jgi:hypothetical protein
MEMCFSGTSRSQQIFNAKESCEPHDYAACLWLIMPLASIGGNLMSAKLSAGATPALLLTLLLAASAADFVSAADLRYQVSDVGEDGSLRRWRDGKAVGDGKPIRTGQGGVDSLIELKNGELISGGRDGSLRRWRDGKAVGNGKPIPTGQWMGVWSLIELKNGGLISGGGDGSLKIYSPQVVKGVIQAACEELREHPALLDPQTTAETVASGTCRSRGLLK